MRGRPKKFPPEILVAHGNAELVVLGDIGDIGDNNFRAAKYRLVETGEIVTGAPQYVKTKRKYHRRKKAAVKRRRKKAVAKKAASKKKAEA